MLPGVRIADRLAGGAGPSSRDWSLLSSSRRARRGIGGVLVALGLFSGVAVAIVAVFLAVTSLPIAVEWVRESRPEPATVGWAAALALPWAAAIGWAGWPPSDTLQWYYAGLGAQLKAAGGIPTSVAEWGRAIRWLPDYLVFNIDSQAFLAALRFVPRADALAAWRVPVTLLGILLIFAVLRLWLAPTGRADRHGADRRHDLLPRQIRRLQARGARHRLGLAALWLVVRGVRSGRRSWVLLGGAAWASALSVHAIAATVMGLVVAAFAAGRVDRGARPAWRALGWLFVRRCSGS